MLKGRKIVGAVFTLTLALMPSIAISDAVQQTGFNSVLGIATDVNRNGMFKVEERVVEMGVLASDAFRLWGVLPNPGVLETLIEGKRIGCTEYGSTHMQLSNPISIVSCKFIPALEDFEWPSINLYLVETGQGTEICTETRGIYRTCSASD